MNTLPLPRKARFSAASFRQMQQRQSPGSCDFNSNRCLVFKVQTARESHLAGGTHLPARTACSTLEATMENNLPPTNPPPSSQPASPLPPPPPRASVPPPVLPPRVVVEPSRKGRGWKITAIVLIAVLALIVMGNIVSLFQGA